MRTLFYVLCASLLINLAYSPVFAQFGYREWTHLDSLSLVGDVWAAFDHLSLSPAARMTRGAVWYKTKQAIDNFETIFQYSVSGGGGIGGGYADGIAFVIQNSGIDAIGVEGGAIGYGGISNSLAIEFDNWKNSENRDPSSNHVAVQTGGTAVNSQIHKPNYCLDTTSYIPKLRSAWHLIKIRYVKKSLYVYVDDMANPVLTTKVDIEKTLDLKDGLAWVGFTAATGNAYQNSDISRWTFGPIEPIVIIPGLGTSSLYQSDSEELYENSRLWVNIDRLLSIKDSFLDTLQMADDGASPYSPTYQIKVAPLSNDHNHTIRDELDRSPLSTYKDMVNYFVSWPIGYVLDDFDNNHSEGENLFIFTYDWRKSILSIAGNLSDRIDSILSWTGGKRVRIVAHSMGGLIVKQLIQAYGTARINQIAFIATPHLGAPKSTYTLQSGKLFDYSRLVINSRQIKKIMRNFPSAYSLLPSPTYFDWYLNNDISAKPELYQSYVMNSDGELIGYENAMDYWRELEIEPGVKEFNTALLDSATDFHNRLANIDFGEVKLFNIVGFGISTIGVVKNSDFDYNNLPALGVFSLNGDGTVPLRSAEIINQTIRLANCYVYMGNHSDMCSYPEVLSRLIDWIDNPSNTLVEANMRVFPHPPASYANSSFFVRVGSPVSLEATDQSNNYVGPTSSIAWSSQIPGSNFYAASLTDPQAAKIISLPLDQIYKVTIKSQDTSAHFDLAVDQVINGEIKNSIKYDSVITTKLTEATMNLQEVNTNLWLNVNNGDSIPLFAIRPDHLQMNVELFKGWNLLSLGVVPDNAQINYIYPRAVSSLYVYQNGQYQKIDSVLQGCGYWIKFDTTCSVSIYGATKYSDTISVDAGWNMISGLSVPFSVDSVKSYPIDLVDGLAYEFTSDGYKKVSILQPGAGYWIKVRDSGKLILK